MRETLIANNLHYVQNGISILNDISLHMSAGFLHAILGPNGSGKSTLLKILSGVWKHTSGSLLWNNTPIVHDDKKHNKLISLVPQNPAPMFDFLVIDIVAMGRYPLQKHYSDAVNHPLVRQALEEVDAWHLRHRSINKISTGERQRVYIARALATASPILLLDEPTAHLDIRHQSEIWQLMQNLVEQGKIVGVATHELAWAERCCDTATVLSQGHCIGNGPFEALITPKLLKNVFGVTDISTPNERAYA